MILKSVSACAPRSVSLIAVGLSIVVMQLGPLAAQSIDPAPKDKQERRTPPAEEKSERSQRRPLRAPGASIPTDPAKRAQLLRDLYALLATAEDQENATAIANAIEQLWSVSASDTVKVLMERAAKANAEQRQDLALRMLDTVTKIAPDLPEGFNRRAFIYYSLNEVERAMGDLRRVLALDPNHYKALDGLGQILREIGRKEAALQVYRRLYAVHPFWPNVKNTLDELERTEGGQGI